jgi:glycosyltransferase involved in cell wall biosynthesis
MAARPELERAGARDASQVRGAARREEKEGSIGNVLRIVWTTPHGPGGAGGMDSLTQLVTGACASDPRRLVSIIPLTTKGRWGVAAGACVFACALARFALLARRGGVDVLHINVAAYGSAYRKMILARLARRLGVAYVVHIHTGRFGEFWNGAGGYVTAALEHFFTHSEAVIVLGQHFARMVTLKLPQLQAKVHVLANATAARRTTPRRAGREQPVQITNMGLLGRNKNTMQLIEALQKLNVRADWHATIAGNGAVDAARDYVKSVGLADRVSLPGWIDRVAVQELLSNTDIFVLPSLSEAMPMAILEALSHGIPVIATPVGAVPDVVRHEENGLLVPVGDLEALVQALRRLIEDGELRRSLGARGLRDHSERYTLQAYMKRITEIWRSAADGRCRGGAHPSRLRAVEHA